jgi:hypothetical protein
MEAKICFQELVYHYPVVRHARDHAPGVQPRIQCIWHAVKPCIKDIFLMNSFIVKKRGKAPRLTTVP